MVESLIQHISSSGDHLHCNNELEALIDIATFKDPGATSASRKAELGLLDLYGDRQTSSAVRQDMVRQLMEAEQIIASPNAYTMQFAMPASLLHLLAQHVRQQIAEQEPDVVTDPVHLEEMKRAVADAAGLIDEPDIACLSRFVTTAEVLASLAPVPGIVDAVINLSDYVPDEDKQWNLQQLLDKVPDRGVALAPLLVNNHFMLIAATKSDAAGEYDLTVANTLLSIDEELSRVPESMRADPALGDLLTKEKGKEFSKELTRKMQPAFAHRVNSMHVNSRHLQAYTADSCGPLVSLLAEAISAYNNKHANKKQEEVGSLIGRWFNEWSQLNPQQRRDMVMARRAKMMGDMVEWKSETRFVDSETLRPRKNAKTEDARL